ncbi:MAG TPA: hypothetical protein VK210_00520, partial [Terriglobia bacterium]|nr:hypothetical protein [Terriglobia bacterium]
MRIWWFSKAKVQLAINFDRNRMGILAWHKLRIRALRLPFIDIVAVDPVCEILAPFLLDADPAFLAFLVPVAH